VTTDAFVYDAIRTPRGRGKSTGALHGTKPIDLVVGLVHEMLRRLPGLDPAAIDDVVLGVVAPVGDQGADIAKIAAIAGGLPDTVAGVQENRYCASGLEAVNLAAAKVRSGWEDLILAGGVEFHVPGAHGVGRRRLSGGTPAHPKLATRLPAFAPALVKQTGGAPCPARRTRASR
jgi:acetyl-CoA acetyltransferase